MLKVGIIGCGGIAHAHADGWLAAGDLAKVTAVCDVDPGNRAKMAEKVGGAEGFTDWSEMLAKADLDAVDICLPHHLHKAAIVAAADAGKHVLCEKPLCISLAEAAEIVAAQGRNGITIACAHNQIFTPCVQRARQLLDEGVFGRVLSVKTADCFRISRDQQTWGWRASLATAGGGELIDTGYHPSYLLLYLAGSRPKQVTAMVQNFDQPLLEGEDSANVLVRFENGAMGQIFTSWSWEWPGGFWKFHVIGEKGQMWGSGQQFFRKMLGQDVEREELPPMNGFHAETRHFAECLASGARPVQSEEDGIAVLRVILGAYEASREGRVVAL
ncbi:MAG TPA: Gfo/Idh/MocA family oxidoreductase [Armatimonadetes bacterium]|jgi:predicted dehydrogenase|nr:Gfo/Idh/MocA family oxidoreductase [Armatimonadota bacterium]